MPRIFDNSDASLLPILHRPDSWWRLRTPSRCACSDLSNDS